MYTKGTIIEVVLETSNSEGIEVLQTVTPCVSLTDQFSDLSDLSDLSNLSDLYDLSSAGMCLLC